MPGNPELNTLREILHDAAVLAGRLSSAVSNGELPPECAGAVAATRDCVLAAQQCASLVELGGAYGSLLLDLVNGRLVRVDHR